VAPGQKGYKLLKGFTEKGFKNALDTVMQSTTRGVFVDAAVFDPYAGRLTDLAKDTPIDAVLPDYLESEETDSEAEARLKNAIEGAGLGFAIDTLIAGFRGMRRAKRLKELKEARAKKVELPRAGTNAPSAPAVTAMDAADSKAAADINKLIDDLTPAAKAAEEAEAAAKPAAEKTIAYTDGAAPSHKFVLDQQAVRNSARAFLAGEPGTSTGELIGINEKTIDWTALKEGKDIYDLLDSVGQLLDPMLKDQPGFRARTWQQANVLASLVGARSAEGVLRTADKVSNLDAHVVGNKAVLLASAARLNSLAKAFDASGSDADLVAYLRHFETHAGIQAAIRKSRSEMGRALNAWKNLNGAVDANDFKAVDDILIRYGGREDVRAQAARIAKLRDAAEIGKVVRKSRYQHVRDGLLEVYINSLLSSVKGTVVLNNLANGVQVATGIAERAVAAAIGKVRGGADRVETAEVKAMLFGNFRGFTETVKLAGKNAWTVAKTAEPITDPIERLEHTGRKAIYVDTTGLQGKALKAAEAYNAAGEVVRTPQRVLMIGDEFFKTVAYQQQLHALAAREAAQQVRARGLKGAEAAREEARIIHEIRQLPPDEVRVGALEFARYQTFQTDLGTVGKSVQNIVNKVPTLRLILPFVKTPTNLLKQSFERFPGAAALLSESRAEWAKGGAARDMVIAKQAMGAAYMGAIWWAVQSGAITGSGGPDAKNRGGGQAGLRADGWQPYSIKVGDTWVSYQRLDPVASLIGTVANLHEILSAAGTDIDGDLEVEAHEAVALTTMATVRMVTDKAWTQGIADFLEALEADDGGSAVARWANRTGANFVYPAALSRSVAQSVDPVVREAFTFSETLKKQVPGLSDELPAKRDVLGREVRLDTGAPGWTNLVNPIAVSADKADPVTDELARLQVQVAPLPKSLNGVKLDVFQFGRLNELVGTVKVSGLTLEERLKVAIESPRYARMTDDDGEFEGSKGAYLKALIAQHRALARAQLLKEQPLLGVTVDARKTRAALAKRPK
jgi:hypothetical protein